jgi:hypothetical protein
MSANNLLKIKKINNTRKPVFELEELDADTGKRIGRDSLGVFDDLEKAIKCANDYMETEEVEYGLYISF